MKSELEKSDYRRKKGGCCKLCKPHKGGITDSRTPRDAKLSLGHQQALDETKEADTHRALDDEYQRRFKDAPENPPLGWMPRCPRCEGEMKAWDAWLVTGATCTKCGWGMTEGTGCLL